MSSTRVVLFEDHHWCRMLPLCASVPAWELRVGMFSLKERLGFQTGFAERLLRGREVFRDFPQDPQWKNHWIDPRTSQGDLWLSSRLGPDWDVIQFLGDAARADFQFVWLDENGLVAAHLPAEISVSLNQSWSTWLSAFQAGCEISDAQRLAWNPTDILPAWAQVKGPAGEVLLVEGGRGESTANDFVRRWSAIQAQERSLLNWIWELVPATESAIGLDIAKVAGNSWSRVPFGLLSSHQSRLWGHATPLNTNSLAGFQQQFPGVYFQGEVTENLHLGANVALEPGVLIDAKNGPVILDLGVQVMAGSRLEGPLYLGPGCIVKAGARIYGGSSFGIGCRLAGEIGETVGHDFINKQHDGFIGHAVLGSWINLGAMTTCSDLKNNYGPVRVDLGWGPIDSGSRFVGLMAGDHVKTAIGTLFNTGTSVGFAANIFGGDMPPKLVPSFSWGGAADAPPYDVERALTTAAIVMGRRGCVLTPAHEALLRKIAAETL